MNLDNDIFEYFDDSLGRSISIPDFGEVDNYGLSTTYREPVYRAIYHAITVMIDNVTIDKYPCFCMNGIIFDIDRNGMEVQVKNCIDFFIGIEEYEKCELLNNYLKG